MAHDGSRGIASSPIDIPRPQMGAIASAGVPAAPLATGADRRPLRLAAILLFAGVLLSAIAGFFHPGRELPNDHHAAFAEYAASGSWTAVHLGQFAGMAILVAGLLVLFVALDVRSGTAGWLNRGAAVAAAIALALYGALQAVDGVALKQAVDAWASAPDGEKAARFASAETVRWLEWGVRSYQSIGLGLAFLLFAATIIATGRFQRPLGALIGLSGLAYLAQGWILGAAGFSASNTLPTLVGIGTTLIWSVWLLIAAWRMHEPSDTPSA